MNYIVEQAETVTGEQMSRHFARWQDRAQLGPVIVRHYGRPRSVLISHDFYVSLQSAADGDGAAREMVLERRLQAVLDYSSEGFFATDADLNVTAFNWTLDRQRAERGPVVIGAHCSQLFEGGSSGPLVERFLSVLRTGEPEDIEFNPLCTTARSYQLRAFPYAGGLGVFILNRTRERELMARLQTADSLRRAVEALPGLATFTLNVRGLFKVVSPQMASLLGFPAGELVGLRLTDVIGPRDRRHVLDAIEQILAGEAQSFRASFLIRGGQELPVSVGAAPFTDQGRIEGLTGVATPAAHELGGAG